jgi:hypothetical protein
MGHSAVKTKRRSPLKGRKIPIGLTISDGTKGPPSARNQRRLATKTKRGKR